MCKSWRGGDCAIGYQTTVPFAGTVLRSLLLYELLQLQQYQLRACLLEQITSFYMTFVMPSFLRAQYIRDNIPWSPMAVV